MNTITLPVIAIVAFLLMVTIPIKIIVGRRCEVLKDYLLDNCKDLFDSYAEVRDIVTRMKDLDSQAFRGISDDLMDIAERERKITASIKNTIQDVL